MGYDYMKYELRHEVWNEGFCLAAFRYEGEAKEYLAKLHKSREFHNAEYRKAGS